MYQESTVHAQHIKMEKVYNCMLYTYTYLSIIDEISTFEELEKKIKDVLDAMHIQL